MNFLNYFKAGFQVVKELRKQRRFNQAFLVHYLSELENKYQGSFSKEQLFKYITCPSKKYLPLHLSRNNTKPNSLQKMW